MTRICTICDDPKHDEIDRRCRLEKDIAKIAKEFSLSYPALYRHISANHHIREVTTIPTTAELATSEEILKEIKEHHTEAKGLLLAAKNSGDLKTALLGIDKALKCLELMAKIQGQINEQPQLNVNLTNIYNSPEWSKVGEALADALADYPELRRSVAGRLLTLVRGGR